MIKTLLIVNYTYNILLSGSTKGEIVFYNQQTTEKMSVIKPFNGRITDLIIKDNLLFASSTDNDIKYFDISLGPVQVGLLTGHRGGITSMALSKCKKYLLSGSMDSSAILWDVHSNIQKQVKSFNDHIGPISAVAFGSNNSIFTGSWDQSIIEQSIDKDNVYKQSAHEDEVTCIKISENGKFLASGSMDNTIHIQSTESKVLLKILIGHSKTVNCLTFNSDGAILSGSEDGQVFMWNLNNGKVIKRMFYNHNILKLEQNNMNFILATQNKILASKNKKIQEDDTKSISCFYYNDL